jgi:hypothetical protein
MHQLSVYELIAWKSRPIDQREASLARVLAIVVVLVLTALFWPLVVPVP